MKYTITKNAEFGSLEVRFNEKPAEDVRDALKALRLRWHGKNACWYGFADEAAIRDAIETRKATAQPKSKGAKKTAITERDGVRVGDLFYTSWGYEQTNVDFFQVIGFVGEKSVRVREVRPRMVSETGVSGMSADRRYEITNKILPPIKSSVFIRDNEAGDVRRLQKTYSGEPCFNVGLRGGYQDTAQKYSGGVLYESWYA